MIVEFLKLPGAGKSTLARLTAEALMRGDITAKSISFTHAYRVGSAWQRVRKAGLAVAVLACDPRRSLIAIKSIPGAKQESLVDLL
jgi:hypothetical protein